MPPLNKTIALCDFFITDLYLLFLLSLWNSNSLLRCSKIFTARIRQIRYGVAVLGSNYKIIGIVCQLNISHKIQGEVECRYWSSGIILFITDCKVACQLKLLYALLREVTRIQKQHQNAARLSHISNSRSHQMTLSIGMIFKTWWTAKIRLN